MSREAKKEKRESGEEVSSGSSSTMGELQGLLYGSDQELDNASGPHTITTTTTTTTLAAAAAATKPGLADDKSRAATETSNSGSGDNNRSPELSASFSTATFAPARGFMVAPTQSRVTSQCAFTNPETVYKSLVIDPRKDRFERWANERTTAPGRTAAKGAVKTANFVANHPLKIVVGVWATLLVFNVYNRWGLEQSEKNGGNGNAVNVFMHATIDTFYALAIPTLVFLTGSWLWKKARGPKRPDPKPFKEYVEKLKGIDVSQVPEDQWLKKAITDPKKPFHKLSEEEYLSEKNEWTEAGGFQAQHEEDAGFDVSSAYSEAPKGNNQAFELWYNKEAEAECQQFVSFHTGMISWLTTGGSQSATGEHNVRGLWEEMGYLMQNLCEHFPSHFDNVVAATPGSHAVLGTQGQPSSSRVQHHVKATRQDSSLKIKAQNASLGAMQGAGHAGMNVDEHFGTNANLLNRAVVAPGNKGKEEVGAAFSAPHETVVPPRDGTDDIYDWELMNTDDGFYKATKEEHQHTQNTDWRKDSYPMDHAKKPFSLDNVSLHVMSHLQQLIDKPQGMSASEDQEDKKIAKVKKFLTAFLSDFVSDPSERTPEKLRDRCLLLVAFLRPVMRDGQWKNWRYFLAPDAVVTGAFKRLSIQERVWMIRTLMSGNDAGKLLALSILQDSRVPVRRFSRVEGRTRMVALKDRVSNSSLTRFFGEYVNEFGELPDGDNEGSKSFEELSRFVDACAEQIAEMASGDRFAGADIFTALTSPRSGDLGENSNLFVGSSRVNKPLVVAEGQSYQVTTFKREGDLGSSFFPQDTNRGEVARALLKIMNSEDEAEQAKSARICALLAPEIGALFTKRTDFIPEALKGYSRGPYDSPEVVKAYIEHAIGGDRYPGWGTAVAYAELQGYTVRIWKHGSGEAGNIERETCFDAENATESEQTIDILISNDDPRNFAELTKIDEATAVQLQQDATEEAETQLTKQEFGCLVAQRAFWLMEKGQIALLNEMQSGTKGYTTGVQGSWEPLYSTETYDNFAAIRDGVLASKTMEGLGPYLLSSDEATRNEGYTILARLLDDNGPDGMECQEIFQKFVKNHKEVLDDDRIMEFLNWLGQQSSTAGGAAASAVANEQYPVAKKRFVAALVTVEGADYNREPEPRAGKILDMLNRFFPDQNLLQMFNTMDFCFKGSESEDESTKRRDKRSIFTLVVSHLRNQGQAWNQILGGCAEESSAERGGEIDGISIDDIVELMAGDVLNNAEELAGVRSTTELLMRFIELTYGNETNKGGGLVPQLQEKLEGQELDKDQRLNLTVMLVGALGQLVSPSRGAHPGVSRAILDAVRAPEQEQQQDQDQGRDEALKNRFEKLGISRGNSHLRLAPLYLDMTLYFLGQAEVAYETALEKARQMEAGGGAAADPNDVTGEQDVPRRSAWNALARVVMNPELYEDIKAPERQRIAEILPRLVHSFGGSNQGYSQSTELQGLVHMTLALFLKDVSNIDMKNYALELRSMFELVGPGDFIAGFNALSRGISEDAGVVAAFTPGQAEVATAALEDNGGGVGGSGLQRGQSSDLEEVVTNDATTKILLRLQVLALYLKYQEMPSRNRFSASRTQARTKVANELRDMWPGEDAFQAESAFELGEENPLIQAFEELGIKEVYDGISNVVRTTDNAGSVSSGESNVSNYEERAPLLKSHYERF